MLKMEEIREVDLSTLSKGITLTGIETVTGIDTIYQPGININGKDFLLRRDVYLDKKDLVKYLQDVKDSTISVPLELWNNIIFELNKDKVLEYERVVREDRSIDIVAKVKKGSKVTRMILGWEPFTYRVDKLKGLTLQEAKDRLKEAQMKEMDMRFKFYR